LDFQIGFDIDILAIFGLAIVLATFSQIWANFSQFSGHPD
jgi:hypothetical protein